MKKASPEDSLFDLAGAVSAIFGSYSIQEKPKIASMSLIYIAS